MCLITAALRWRLGCCCRRRHRRYRRRHRTIHRWLAPMRPSMLCVCAGECVNARVWYTHTHAVLGTCEGWCTSAALRIARAESRASATLKWRGGLSCLTLKALFACLYAPKLKLVGFVRAGLMVRWTGRQQNHFQINFRRSVLCSVGVGWALLEEQFAPLCEI